jgi:hypothetical protein
MMFRRQALIIGMLAAASLLLESTLTRLLAVTQFYHFAFLVVSLALLGYGTSGTILSISPRLRKLPLNQILFFGAVGFIFSVALAYLVVNFLPFDSYSIAWDRRQILFFFLYYLVLTLPFTMSGLAAGAAISLSKGKSHLIYAANLCGSGLGALSAPFTLWLSGIPGSVLFSILIGVVGILLLIPMLRVNSKSRWLIRFLSFASVFGGVILFTILTVLNSSSRSPLGIILSPYKGLSQAYRIPGVETIFGRWNAISRVDVLKNSGTHHLPGLSYIFQGSAPRQLGLSLDADSLQSISLVSPENFQAADYLPEALGFQLRPYADTLVIEPGGGLGILQALSGGSRNVTVVMANPLEYHAAAQSSGEFNVFDDPNVHTVFETDRVFLARDHQRFDVVLIPLTDSYRPISSGAYSLGEDYVLTVEAFEAAVNRLTTDGILIVTRWVQIPPSESLRLVATMVEALDEMGLGNPKEVLVIYRSIQTMTVLVKPSGWKTDELDEVRDFARKRKFDLVWTPGIQEHEINVFNRLQEPVYYTNIRSLLLSPVRTDFYDSYPFNIQPSSDNKPFFYHFFKWEQTPEVLSTIGHIWQPFGGSGYLVTLALLLLVVLFSFLLITLPLFLRSNKPAIRLVSDIRWKALLYFTFLGIGFMFVEIPLIQKSILYLGHPIVAFTVIVFTILVFSSLGSAMASVSRIQSQRLLISLAGLALIIPLFQEQLNNATLGWSLVYRTLLTMVPLAPLAIAMGLPFPLGIIWLEKKQPGLVPWVWAVNGSTSVVASVLAAILALTYGFRFVQFAGAMMYFGAILVYVLGFRFSKNSQETNPPS